MKSSFVLCLVGFLLISTVCVHQSRGELLEWVVAMVDGYPITNGELVESVNTIVLDMQRHPTEGELTDIRKMALERSIEDRLLLAEAERQGISISDREMDVLTQKEFSAIKARYDDEKTFREVLERMGLSEAGLKASLRDEMLREYLMKGLIQRRVIASVEVTKEEVEKFRTENPKEYAEFEQVRLAHILIRCATDADASAMKRSTDILETLGTRVRSGEDFGVLAQEFSEHETSRESGGDLGYVKRGDLLPELENAAFSMKVGDISAPIRTRLGYHIILLMDRRDPANFLVSLKAKDKLQEYLAKLRERAHIDVFVEAGTTATK